MTTTKINLEDIEALEALMDAIATVRQHALEQNQQPVYTLAIQKETVRLQSKLGVTTKNMNRELGLANNETEEWIMKHRKVGNDVGVRHGDTVRYDIPTKCLVVKMHLEDGIPGHKLADMYDVSQSAISQWKSRYKDNYNQLIKAPEGTIIIGKEDKRVIGLPNILKIKKLSQSAAEIIKEATKALGDLHSDDEPVNNALNTLDALSNSFDKESA